MRLLPALPAPSTQGFANLFGKGLVSNTMASYIPLIGLADERWNLSAGLNGRFARCL
jgi:hypothetical protein